MAAPGLGVTCRLIGAPGASVPPLMVTVRPKNFSTSSNQMNCFPELSRTIGLALSLVFVIVNSLNRALPAPAPPVALPTEEGFAFDPPPWARVNVSADDEACSLGAMIDTLFP